jgi:hypothetical protein
MARSSLTYIPGFFVTFVDMLNMFAVSTYHLSLIVFEIKDEKY